MGQPPRIEVLGCPVDVVTLEQSLQLVEGYIAAGGVHTQVSINAYKVMATRRDPEMAALVRGSDLVTADGAGVVIGARVLGQRLPERVPGIELFLGLMARAAQRGWRPYLLGASQEVLDAVLAEFARRHPALTLAGHRNGYFDDADEAAIAADIRDSRADLLFVAISSPKKEHFLGRWGAEMNVPFMMGVGGSFDVLAGKVERAPGWMQRLHLEWAWRTALEPKRLTRAPMQLTGLFALAVGRAWVRGERARPISR